uniref:Glycosyl hydrolase family 32 N-terminal domain-containing protein n=1 Tax=Ananas comosus var. bracteatus TaxID=296719 RepID=A0A6V7P6U8_ANACO|nr:unnamed protein product [Ananas comosus var. bracteatus]
MTMLSASLRSALSHRSLRTPKTWPPQQLRWPHTAPRPQTLASKPQQPFRSKPSHDAPPPPQSYGPRSPRPPLARRRSEIPAVHLVPTLRWPGVRRRPHRPLLLGLPRGRLPVVERYLTDASERWLMWYHGLGPRGGADAVGIAVSNNGVHWERGSGDVASGDDVGRVMGQSTDWWAFDTERVRPSDVLIMSSAKLRTPGAVYWLYYTGFGPEKVAFPNAAPSENGVSKSLRGSP